jgi:SAM-dependent methyltransferase
MMKRNLARLLLALTFASTAFASTAFAADEPKSVSPYVPSPESVVSDMLKLAEVNAKDFVIDLGSGDGRIVLTAAKVFGASGFGVEIIDELVRLSNETAKKEGVADRVRFMKQDLFVTDISKATVLTMYLLPDIVNRLRDKLLKELRPGTRILSHDYPLTGWIPEDRREMDLEEKKKISGVTTTIIYLYQVPAKVDGRWTVSLPASLGGAPILLDLKQQLTRFSGSARTGGREALVEDARIRGEQVSFKLPINGRLYDFSGTVRGNAISGTVEGSGGKGAWSATLAK